MFTEIDAYINFDNLYDLIDKTSISYLISWSFWRYKMKKGESYDSEFERGKYVNDLKIGYYSNYFSGDAVLMDGIKDIKRNLTMYKWLYDHLYEEASKRNLVNIMLYRIFADEEFLDFSEDKNLTDEASIDCHNAMHDIWKIPYRLFCHENYTSFSLKTVRSEPLFKMHLTPKTKKQEDCRQSADASDPIVTVCMQVFNTREEYLREAIESVLNQTLKRLTFVMIDNASTDGSGQIMEEYAKKDARVKIVCNKVNTRGCVYQEMLNAETVYCATLDSDDFYEPHFLEDMCNLSKNYDADIVICGMEDFDELDPCQLPEEDDVVDVDESAFQKRRAYTTNSKMRLEGEDIYLSHLRYYHQFVPHWGKLYRTSVIKKTNYTYDPAFASYNNAVFILRNLENTKIVAMNDSVLHQRRLRQGSLSLVDDANADCHVKKIYNTFAQYMPCIEKALGGHENYESIKIRYAGQLFGMIYGREHDSVKEMISRHPISAFQIIKYIFTDDALTDEISDNSRYSELILNYMELAKLLVKEHPEMEGIKDHFIYKLAGMLCALEDEQTVVDKNFVDRYMDLLHHPENKHCVGLMNLKDILRRL